MLHRRVLLLSRTFYSGAGLGSVMADPDRLNATILHMLAKDPVTDRESYDQSLGYMIDSEFETTFPLANEGIALALNQLADKFSEERAR